MVKNNKTVVVERLKSFRNIALERQILQKKILKWLLSAIELFAIYLFFKDSYVLSGWICLNVGIIGIIFSLFGFEFMIPIGLMIISIGYQHRLSIIIISLVLTLVGTYDLIQIIRLKTRNGNDKLSQTEWLERFQEKELLHRFSNKLRQTIKKR